jgi:hypothetical protein
MKSFAKEVVAKGYNALVFNQTGLRLYYQGCACTDACSHTIRIRTKGKRFNELLFYMYKRFGLDTKPLIILGRKKVDRGLGFHYAPRRSGLGPTTLDFDGHGPVHTDGKEGLIWTDMFMGYIEGKETAVQKAGRLAGIISQCPQYPGQLTWWVDKQTGTHVERHNKVVDEVNGLSGCHTALQAKTVAEVIHPEEPEDVVDIDTYRIYSDEEVVRSVCRRLGYYYRGTPDDSEGFKNTSLNNKTSRVSLANAVKKVPTAYGTVDGVKTYRTYYPCYVNTSDRATLRFVVIIRPGTDALALQEMDALYPSIPYSASL